MILTHRTFKGLLAGAIVAVAAGSGPVYADDLAEIYNAALQNDPVLGQARANYLARTEVVPQSRAALLPTATVSANTNRIQRRFPTARNPATGQRIPNDNFNQKSWQGQFVQPILRLNSWYQYRSARALSDQAQSDFRTAEQNLIVRVLEAYVEVLRADALLESVDAEETAVKRQLEQVQQRFDVGLVAITDVLESQAAYDTSQVRLIQADGDHDTSFEFLRVLTGIDYRSVSRFKETLPIVDPDPSNEEEWVKVALEHNYTIEAASHGLLASERNVRSQVASYMPDLDGIATYSEVSTGGQSFFGDTETRVYRLQFSLPLYRGGSVASRIREARHRQEESRLRLEERTRVVESTIRARFRSVTTDVLRVVARQHSIESSQAALEATETGYEVGTRNIVDVLEAQQRLYLSQFDYADSRYNYVLDMLRLKETTGTLISEDIYELNEYMDPDSSVQQTGPERYSNVAE